MTDKVKKVTDLTKITNEQIKSQLEFIANLSKLEKSVENPTKLLDTLKPLILNYFYIKVVQELDLGGDSNLARHIIDTLDQLFPLYLKALNDKSQFEGELDTELRSIVMEMVPEIITSVNYITYSHIKFCNKFVELNGLKVLFNYISNPFLLDYYVTCSKNQKSKEFEDINTTLKNSMGSLVCLARTFNNYKNAWKECASVKCFLQYLSKTKDIGDNKIYTTLAISYVADDEDIEKLPELKETIPDLIKVISIASKAIKDNVGLVREAVELDDGSNESKEVCSVTYLGTIWSLINIIKGLYHLAVNDKLKYDIYYKNNMNKHIRLIVYFGNDTEKEYCLNLLFQLCFDKQIAQDVKQDKDFNDFLTNLSTDTTCDKMVNKYAAGTLWLINKKLANELPSTDGEKNVIKNLDAELSNLKKEKMAILQKQDTIVKAKSLENKHVMISYNRDSRDLCMQIKAEVEKMGLKVWIDVEAISGSSLESMANAIENSICVLMCMTEKYKQSSNCRAEAEYAFQLNKPIIPLIMQKDYKPDGWLGIILGSKIFVHFMRYEFSECIRRLKVELDGVLKNEHGIESLEKLIGTSSPIPELHADNENKMYKLALENFVNKLNPNLVKPVNEVKVDQSSKVQGQKASTETQQNTSQIKSPKNDVLKWSEKDVAEWLKKIDVHPNIISNIKSCDGRLLHELYTIKRETPDFFLRALSANLNRKPVLLRDVALFSVELRKLFTDAF